MYEGASGVSTAVSALGWPRVTGSGQGSHGGGSARPSYLLLWTYGLLVRQGGAHRGHPGGPDSTGGASVLPGQWLAAVKGADKWGPP